MHMKYQGAVPVMLVHIHTHTVRTRVSIGANTLGRRYTVLMYVGNLLSHTHTQHPAGLAIAAGVQGCVCVHA